MLRMRWSHVCALGLEATRHMARPRACASRSVRTLACVPNRTAARLRWCALPHAPCTGMPLTTTARRSLCVVATEPNAVPDHVEPSTAPHTRETSSSYRVASEVRFANDVLGDAKYKASNHFADDVHTYEREVQELIHALDCSEWQDVFASYSTIARGGTKIPRKVLAHLVARSCKDGDTSLIEKIATVQREIGEPLVPYHFQFWVRGAGHRTRGNPAHVKRLFQTLKTVSVPMDHHLLEAGLERLAETKTTAVPDVLKAINELYPNVRPGPTVLGRVIRGVWMSDHKAAIRWLSDWMKGHTLAPGVFERLGYELVVLGDLPELRRVVKFMNATLHTPSVNFLSTLQGAVKGCGDDELQYHAVVCGLRNGQFEPSGDLVMQVAMTVTSMRKYERAEQLLAGLNQRHSMKYEADRRLLQRRLLYATDTDVGIVRAGVVLAEMFRPGDMLYHKQVSKIVRGLVDAGKHVLAARALRSAANSARPYDASGMGVHVFRGALFHDTTENLMEVCENLLESGWSFPPTSGQLRKAILRLIRLHDTHEATWTRACSLIRRIAEAGGVTCQCAALHEFAMLKLPENVRSLVDAIQEGGSVEADHIYAILRGALEAKMPSIYRVYVYGLVKRANLELRGNHVALMLSACKQMKNAKEAVKVMQMVKEHPKHFGKLSGWDIQSAAHICLREGRGRDALNLIDSGLEDGSLSEGDESVALLLLRALGEVGDIERSERVLAQLRERDGGVSVQHYNWVLKAYAKHGAVDGIERHMKAMNDVGLEPNEYSHSFLLEGHAVAGNTDKARNMLEQVDSAPRHWYHLLMEAYASKGDFEGVLSVLENDFQAKGLKPSSFTFERLIAAARAHPNMRQCLEQAVSALYSVTYAGHEETRLLIDKLGNAVEHGSNEQVDRAVSRFLQHCKRRAFLKDQSRDL